MKARSYPLHKAGDAYWIYMGPGEPPLFPDYPALRGSSDYRYVTKWRGDCNWMQGHEGNIDPVHTYWRARSLVRRFLHDNRAAASVNF